MCMAPGYKGGCPWKELWVSGKQTRRKSIREIFWKEKWEGGGINGSQRSKHKRGKYQTSWIWATVSLLGVFRVSTTGHNCGPYLAAQGSSGL